MSNPMHTCTAHQCTTHHITAHIRTNALGNALYLYSDLVVIRAYNAAMANRRPDFEPMYRAQGDSQTLDTLDEIRLYVTRNLASHLRNYCAAHQVPVATFVRRLITREIGDTDAKAILADRAQAAATSVLAAIADIEGYDRRKRTRSQQ